jgi:hypothetical protein
MLLSLPILLWTMLTATMVNANPDPVNVAWYVTDAGGTPIDGASLTIYWATSPGGPFTVMPEDDPDGTYVLDRIPDPDVKQNPIYTGYKNPEYPHGMAICDVHPKEGLEGLYFYVEINYDSVVEYWPTATSYKPGEPGWEPVEASGSPSGYAAAGPGIGTGPTTAYPTRPPPPHVIPEVPLGSVMATVSMIIAFGAYFGLRRRKRQLIF